MEQALDIVEEKDIGFMSVVEDVHEFGVQVRHDGMSLRQAHTIVRQARKAGYQARTQELPNGNYQVVVDDRVVVENKQQWKLYQIVLPSTLGDVTKEDELAEKAAVSLGTVSEFKRKNKQPLSRYMERLKPIVVEDEREEETDLTELTQTDIDDMTQGMQSVYEPKAQMNAVDRQA
jgi:rRNA maturation endonuclease Nob1